MLPAWRQLMTFRLWKYVLLLSLDKLPLIPSTKKSRILEYNPSSQERTKCLNAKVVFFLAACKGEDSCGFKASKILYLHAAVYLNLHSYLRYLSKYPVI